jgi:hypothetical protein
LRQVGWAERQVRRADRFQQRHTVLAFPVAVAQKFGNDQAGGKAALMAYYGLFALFPLLLLLVTIAPSGRSACSGSRRSLRPRWPPSPPRWRAASRPPRWPSSPRPWAPFADRAAADPG